MHQRKEFRSQLEAKVAENDMKECTFAPRITSRSRPGRHSFCGSESEPRKPKPSSVFEKVK